jgi:squalene-hopene/tetraprenyl-beta-curcumene cyclase
MTDSLPGQLQDARDRVVSRLLAERGPEGHWTGELSSSALATAVASIALGELDRRLGSTRHSALVEGGLAWLALHANPDGGWGDTTRSRTNLSTTALVWAAFGAAGADSRHADTVRRAIHCLAGLCGRPTDPAAPSLTPESLVPAIEARYGSDRTFSVPIVMTLALSGRLGPRGWRQVRPLPFELAALPRSWFGALRLPVVSYALPALIALGQAIHRNAPSRNPIARFLRNRVARRTLGLLTGLQPSSGGFLEAIPLTAFVTMALASFGETGHPVVDRSAMFLRNSVRPDGSWPIDTNLATWTTTLAIKALARAPEVPAELTRNAPVLREWLLQQQYRVTHPYTGAAPGGWAWTDLPGGVPDADDTAGALLALKHLETGSEPAEATRTAAAAGTGWLLDLQNRDGGIPTFCRGWGTLPFDRSAPELTAHALRAWHTWDPFLPAAQRERIRTARRRALEFLRRSQRPDGSWVPLWFGNELAPGEENPVFGTSLVLLARNTGPEPERSGAIWSRGRKFLEAAQNPDGSWGGARGTPGTVEETSLALTALSESGAPQPKTSIERATKWLAARINADHLAPSPIGLYFARLWYHERLYPLVWSVEALNAVLPDPSQP